MPSRPSHAVSYTHLLRVMGKKYALLTFAGDLFKGIAAVLIGKAWLGTQAGEIVGAFGAILGHNFPLYFGFKGGKGIATSFGCLLVVFPVQTPVSYTHLDVYKRQHQQGDQPLSFGHVLQRHLHQLAVFRVHGRLPQLRRVHFAKSFIKMCIRDRTNGPPQAGQTVGG